MRRSAKKVLWVVGSALLGSTPAWAQTASAGGDNGCEAFARLDRLEEETPAQAAGAISDARAHNNGECMSLVALRRLSRGDCDGGLGLAREATRMNAGIYLARCAEGLAWVCAEMHGARRTADDEGLATCGAEIPRRMAAITVACSLETNLTFTRVAALEATRDLARVCRDPGGVILATVSTLARVEANSRPLPPSQGGPAARRALLQELAPELGWIRRGQVPPSIEAAQTVEWAARWTQYRGAADPAVHPMRRRMRRVLLGSWGAAGALPDNAAVTYLTHGLLGVGAQGIGPTGGAFGELIDDVERLSERGVFGQPRAALGLMPVPFLNFANAAMEPAFRGRLDRLRTRLCGLGTNEGALYCFRLGAALVPADEAPCERAERFARVMEEFRSTGAARSLRPDFVDPDWTATATEAVGAARRCERGGETLLAQVETIRDGLRGGVQHAAP